MNQDLENILNFEKIFSIIDLFGDYLTFNQIIKYQNNKTNQIDIASKLYDNNEGILTIWINEFN